jgi:hypothetical protein
MRLWRGLSLVQHTPAINSIPLSNALAFAADAIGAGIAALGLCISLFLLVRSHFLFLACCLSIAVFVSLVPEILIGINSDTFRYAVIQVPGLIAFCTVCWLVAARFAARKPQQAA